ncbi:hypothetical protein EDB19DRAFT_1722292 [Suillus lakei]|nr:hypothetical protein EDB19DRAFT_1722292 [Suillus lakei]
MPSVVFVDSSGSYFLVNLTKYVDEGYVSMARLDGMATRIIAALYYLQQDENYPATNYNFFNPHDEVTNKHVNLQADHYRFVRQIGAAGTVLLKNRNGALPLNIPRNLALIGSDAGPGTLYPTRSYTVAATAAMAFYFCRGLLAN